MRRIPFTLGAATLGLAWMGPFHASSSFVAHMTVHMSVVAVAAPLIALGVAGSRFDPSRRMAALFSPLLASLAELAIVWLWHTPLLHLAARQHAAAFILEQATFLLSGLYLWVAVFGGEPEARPERRGAGIIALLLTAMHMTLLGALLALSPRPLYLHAHATHMPPLEDQHLGGAIMLLVGGLSYLAGGLWLAVGMLSEMRLRQPPLQSGPACRSHR